VRRPIGLAVAGALVASATAVLAPQSIAAAGPGDGTLTVRLIRDVNGNGSYEPAVEVGVQGIPVTVTDPAGATATGTTGSDGTVVVGLGPVNGGRYRVEAAIPATMPDLKPAPAGNGLSSLTEFVNVAGGTNANLTMGVWNPGEYCQANPDLVTCSLAKGDNTGARGVTRFSSQLGTTPPGGPATQLTTSGQQGAVFGIGTDRTRNVYLGTFVKRHTEYGPAGAVNAIYRLNLDNPGVSTFVTLSGTLTAHDKSGSVPYLSDDTVYDKVGREGLGDVDVSADGRKLYAVNLNNSSLYTVPIQGTGTAVTAGAASAFPVPRPGSNCVGDWHPFGIGVRGTRVLVGGVCGAESTVSPAKPAGDPSKLRAHVLTFTGSGFTPLFDFPLDYPRGCAFRTPTSSCKPGTTTAGAVLSGMWEAWNTRVPSTTPGGFSDFVSAPQPMLTNIEIADRGDLIIGMRDRFADMQGNETEAYQKSTLLRGIAAGDVLRACVSGAGFALESNGSCGSVTGNEPGNNQGPGGGEFYNDEWTDGNFHEQTSTGGLVTLPGRPDVWTTRIDPFDNRPFRQGVSRLSGTGAEAGLIELQNTDAGNNGLFGKANGLADLEAICDSAPVQLGNRVWFDTDSDGIQDGDEPPLPGVRVTATPCAGDAPLPVKTTDARGEYYFGTADGLKPDTCYNLAFDYSGVSTANLPGAPPLDRLRWTAKEAGESRTADSNVDSAGTASVTLGAAGSVDHTVDAGVAAAPTNKLGDFVWVDTNRNGSQDDGEPAVSGVTAILKRADGTEVARQPTDVSGRYLFDGLPDGEYKVCFDLTALPAPYTGFLATRPDAGDDAKDSDVDAAGCTPPTTLGPDKRADLTLDAGIRPPDRLGDLVWVDTNRNGLQDGGEPGVPGVTVTARRDGTTVGTTTTDANGKYLFDTLPDGTYMVCFDLAALPGTYAEYQLTKADEGSDDATDSDADPATGCTEPVTLTVDQPENLTLDAGLVPPVNRLGDLVWVDTNRNGIQDAGEPGVPGVAVTVRLPDGTQVGAATTDANGKYLVEGLTDGSYQVCFGLSSLPAPYTDYRPTQADAGDDTADSDADPTTGCTPPVPLGPGKRENLTLDAGIVPPPNKLGDLVWVDTNRNGLQDSGEPGVPGVTVTVKDASGTQVGSTTTGPDGRYLFDDLTDGTFTVCFGTNALPAGYADFQVTKPNAGDDGTDSDADPATGCAEPVTLGPGKRENLTVDAGIVAPANRLGDYVWVDTNRNGLQDTGEPGVQDVTAILRSTDGTDVARTTTGPDGKYLFDNLTDGTHRVCFDITALPSPVADYTVTQADAGDDAADSDADTTGCTPTTTLGVGKREDLTLDAGLVAPPNKLGDYVWVDTNRNGLQDTGEPGVRGATVVLRSGDAEAARTTTGADGKYLFDNLPDGTYRVCFDLTTVPADYAGYLPTRPNAGNDAADSEADPATGCTEPVSLGVGKRENLTLDAGIRPPNSLGDRVWVDVNRNGLQDPGEPGAGGVTVTLKSPDGKEIGRTTTDPNGGYGFGKLSDGQYVVCFDRATLPAQYAGFQLARPNAGDDAADSDADPATWCTPPATLSADHPDDPTLDAGIVSPANRIGDYAWVDRNGNGLQDPGEPAAPGVPVALLDKDGKEIAGTSTDPSGKYLFDNLPDGTYQVCFRGQLPTALHGYTLTRPKAGDDAVDSDADQKTGCTRAVTVGPTQREVLTLDAGLLAPAAAAVAAGSHGLSVTGANLGWLIMVALLALATGTLLALSVRRRRRTER
jgi:hypothetical protein